MSELSREQIETVRVLAQHYDGTPVELFGVSVRALCDMALRTHDAETENTKLRDSTQFTEDWYCVRWARLRDLVKESAPDLWPDVASVMANGTASPGEPPTYAQRLNHYRHRTEKAEEALRYLHNFPNAPAAHESAEKVLPPDEVFDERRRAR